MIEAQGGSDLKKLEHLNGLRGMAALVVVVHHFACAFLPFAIWGAATQHTKLDSALFLTPLQVALAGNFAVCLFFILSGFVLSYGYFQRGGTTPVWPAAAKRYFRLMPPILVSVLLSYLILHLNLDYTRAIAPVTGSAWLAAFWPDLPSLGQTLYDGTYGVILGSSNPGIFNNALWTMKIEFLGSMLVFAFLALFGRIWSRWAVYLILAYMFWKTYYIGFVAGMALADFYATRWSPRTLTRPVLLGLVALGLWLATAPIPDVTTLHTQFSELVWRPNRFWGTDPTLATTLLHTLGAFMLLAGFIYSPLLKRIFSSRPLAYLGKISFSMYLLHLLVLGSFTSYMFKMLIQYHSYGVSMLLAGSAYMVIVFIASDIYTRYVDQPAVKLAALVPKGILALKNRLMHARKPTSHEAALSPDQLTAGLSASSASRAR